MDSQRPHTPQEVAACEARHARRLAMLGEMAEIGMAICRDLGRRAAAEAQMAELALARAQAEDAEATGAAGAQAPPRAGVDLELKFYRISRAVRQTLALEAKLESDLEANAVKFKFQRETAIRDISEAAFQAGQRKAFHRRHVSLAVRRAIDDQASDSDYERLIEGLDARIGLCRDDPAFVAMPVGDCVTMICASLGLKAEPAYWEDEDLWDDDDEDEDGETAAETDPRAAAPADDPDDEDDDDDPGGSPGAAFDSPPRRQVKSIHRGLRPLSEARAPNRTG